MNDSIKTRYLFNDEAAKYIGFKPSTLRLSRHTGVLAGVDTPEFFKVGKSIRYDIEDLNQWMSQFRKYKNTSQTYF